MSSKKLYLYKRPNGYWYIGFWRDGRRFWKSAGTRSKPEALHALREFEEKLDHLNSFIRFREFADQFCSLQSTSLRTSTIERIYLPAFKSFEQTCGNRTLTSYTLKDVEIFKRSMLDNGRSPVWVNMQFRALRAAFNKAIKWRYLSENPFAISSQIRVGERLPAYLTPMEFQGLMGIVKENLLKRVFLLAALTGMRLGEIVSLTWDRVDLTRQLIIISSSGGFQTKTGKQRVIPLNLLLHSVLAQMRNETCSSQFVFVRKGAMLHADYVSRKFKKYSRLAGLSEGVHFHSLRHTFATWLVQGGVNIYEVQKLLGHSSVTVTEVYSHLAASDLHDSVNKIQLPSPDQVSTL